MKVFEVPEVEIVRFGKQDVLTTSCTSVCDCVDCLPCEIGNDCKYYDTCPKYCAKDSSKNIIGSGDPY